MTRESPVSRHLRARKIQIARVWTQLVRAELPDLQRLDTAALIDHLPEFIDGLARWLDGETTEARAAFSVLAEGHALQRLGYGIDLLTLIREYILLRTTIMREVMAVPSSEANREHMVRLNEGMDEAIYEAVRRFTHRREDLHDHFVGRLMTEAIELATERNGGIAIELRDGDMGELWEQAISEVGREHPQRSLHVSRRGDLGGVWDRDRVKQAVATLLENVIEHAKDPIEVSLREAEDRQSLVTSVRYQGPEIPLAQLYTMREIVLAHGAYWDVAPSGTVTTFAITWPRTPFDEGPART